MGGAVRRVLAVQVPIVHVVHVIGMQHRFVTAAGAVRMPVGFGGGVVGRRTHEGSFKDSVHVALHLDMRMFACQPQAGTRPL